MKNHFKASLLLLAALILFLGGMFWIGALLAEANTITNIFGMSLGIIIMYIETYIGANILDIYTNKKSSKE